MNSIRLKRIDYLLIFTRNGVPDIAKTETVRGNSKKQKRPAHCFYAPFLLFVRAEGLEPPSREALDPKSSVSTNFTTPAKMMVKCPVRGRKGRGKFRSTSSR